MSSIDSSDLRDLLAQCKSQEDFDAFDALEREAKSTAAKQPDEKWIATSLSEVAAFFGLHIQTVKQWRTESPPMPGDDGKYPLPAIVKWRDDKLRYSAATARKREQENELRQVQIETKRLQLEAKRGLLIERAEVERDIAVIFARVKNRTDALPAEVANLVPGDQKAAVKKMVEEKVRVMQKEMAEGEF